jgi:hypothetical protein
MYIITIMKNLETYYNKLPEPNKSCMLALKNIIMQQHELITHELKYGLPCFLFKGKMFAFLWIHKKLKHPYILFVEGLYFNEPYMEQEKRDRMKHFQVWADKDLPIDEIKYLIQKAINLYINGTIIIKEKKANRI